MNGVVLSVTERLDRVPMVGRLVAVSSLLAMVTIVDVVTGPDLSLALAYAICAMAAAWSLSTRAGVAIAALAAFAGFLVDAVAELDESWGVLVLNHVLRLASFVLFAVLVAAVRSSMSELIVTARVDVMTGALNKHGFLEALARARRVAARAGQPLAVVYFDLDGLKSVNDRDGHAAGDALIRRFADRVGRHLRATDAFGRLGGDEFAVVLERAEPAAIDAVVGRILDDPGLPAVSCGVQVFQGSYPAPSAMLAGADRRMYRDKRGRHATVRRHA